MCPFASCHRLRNLHCTEGPFFSKAELLRTPALGSTATTPASLHQRGAAVHERPRRDNFLVALVAPLETQLAQHLLERTTPRGLDLCLLDISQPLLAAGFQNASEALRGRPGVSVWGMQANFHHLGEYPPLRRAVLQRHLYCLLGGTLGNLDHESRFFRHSLRGEPGDLLLVDLQLARSSPASPEEIKHRERSWASGVPPQIAAWLGSFARATISALPAVSQALTRVTSGRWRPCMSPSSQPGAP